MTESFWFLTGEDDAERPTASSLPSIPYDDFQPVSEPMRGRERKLQRAPSTDEKRVKRQIHRSGSFWDSEGIKPEERVSDWSAISDHDTNDWRIHRTLHIDPTRDPDGLNLWRGMDTHAKDPLPDHEVAHRLLKLVTEHPHLGLHWTADEDHAYRVGMHQGWGHGHSWASGQDDLEQSRSGLESPVVVHARWPKNEHIETDPHVLAQYGVKPFDKPELDDHDESEVPMKTGAPVEITGLSWAARSVGRKRNYRHYDFETPIRHHASKTATVLNTQIERLNKGDRIRTPTGQSAEVKGVRPHETDSTLIYLDTDMGTSTVKRGTDFQTVPYNAQQQELPDTGNPMGSGNTAQLPGTAHGPGGPTSGGAPTAATTCPNCGNSGTLHLQGEVYVCGVCGYTISAKGSPGGLTFTNQPKGYLPGRRKPGEVPKAHVWASKYINTGESRMAHRVQQVLGGDQ